MDNFNTSSFDVYKDISARTKGEIYLGVIGAVRTGAKTGSAQVAGEEEANAVLVCFAPYDAPKIALALVAEQGGSGAALGDAAAAILNAWAAGNLS